MHHCRNGTIFCPYEFRDFDVRPGNIHYGCQARLSKPKFSPSSQLPHFDKRAFNRLKNKEPHLLSEKAAVIKNLAGKIGHRIAP